MSFANITLLECNREQSVQKGREFDNNAIFTNRMGRVIELDVGDTIEVKSAFINKRGCANPDSIEFKGKTLGVESTFTRTTHATTQPTSYSLDNKYPIVFFKATDRPTTEPPDPESVSAEKEIPQDRIVFKQIYNEEVSVSLKDNEAYLETQLYKTSDGESYVFHPRNYQRAIWNDLEPTSSHYYTVDNSIQAYFNRSDFDLDCSDSAHGGALFYQKGLFSGQSRYCPEDSLFFGKGFAGYDNYKKMFLMEDYHNVFQNITYFGTLFPTYKEDKNCYSIVDNNADYLRTTGDGYRMLKPKNDCKRFFVFEREYDWMMFPETINGVKVPSYTFIEDDGSTTEIDAELWFNDEEGGDPLPDSFPKRFIRPQFRSPALFPYIKKVKLNKIEVDTGYSTPQSISEQITKQLQKEDADNPIIYNKGSRFDYTTSLQTGYYEPVNCATEDFSVMNYRNYFNIEIDGERDMESAFRWWKSFNTILIKRPDLYEYGTKINTQFGFVGTIQQQLADPPIDPRNPPDNLTFGISNYILNTIKYDPTLKNNTTDPIITSWLYTEHNLKMLSELFDVQGRYPELFYDETKSLEDNYPFMNIYQGTTEWGEPATIDNSRFLHINRFDSQNTADPYTGGNAFEVLGDDGYVPFTYNNGQEGANLRTFDTDHRSTAFFFKYDKTYRNVDTGGGSTDKLSYGFATKTSVDYAGLGTHYDFITLHPELVNGLRPEIFNMRGGMQPFTNTGPEQDGVSVWDADNIKGYTFGQPTMIGWDYHFSSWGNVVMSLTTGIPLTGSTFDNKGVVSMDNQNGFLFRESYMNNNDYGNDKYGLDIQKSYIGANDIALEYDSVSNRFGFSYLHRPNNVGNLYNGGATYVDVHGTPISSVPLNPTPADEVIKINPRPLKWNWCQELVPYIFISGEIGGVDADKTAPITLDPMNPNYSPWMYYDSRCGVSINFGKTTKIDENKYNISQKQVWNNSLLGILGFSYDQFNPTEITSKNNQLARVSDRNINSLHNPSTNADFLNTNLNSFVINPFGAVQEGTQLPFGLSVELLNASTYKPSNSDTDTTIIYLPAITVPASSVKIEGVDLPRVSLHPYMTIRSDIMKPHKYIGGLNSGLNLPVCAVVDRANAEKDYVQLIGSEVYTVTEPMKFSSITTIITDPDGTLSLLDEGSSVIYKISKADSLSRYNILEEFQKQLSKK